MTPPSRTSQGEDGGFRTILLSHVCVLLGECGVGVGILVSGRLPHRTGTLSLQTDDGFIISRRQGPLCIRTPPTFRG